MTAEADKQIQSIQSRANQIDANTRGSSSSQFSPINGGGAADRARLFMAIARRSDLETQLQFINQARLQLTNILDRIYQTSTSLDPENSAIPSTDKFIDRIQKLDKSLELQAKQISIQHETIQTHIEALQKAIQQFIDRNPPRTFS